MALSVSDLITRIRQAIDDVNGGKSLFKENLRRSRFGDQVGSANTAFQVANGRIIPATIFVSADGAAFAAPATVDTLRGRFTLAAAPATSLLATYDFQFFTDAELTVLLENAASFIGTEDLTFVSVPTGLGDALVFKAGSDAASALSLRAAPFFNAGAGGKTVEKGDIAKKYKDIAADLLARAIKERDEFYGPRKGAATAPAYGQSAPTGRMVGPFTPRR